MHRLQIRRRLPLWLGLVATLLLSGCLSSVGPEAPSISQEPKDRTVFVGQSAKFDFGGSGKPPFTFQWLRNGVIIAGATEATYSTPAVTAADDGAKFSVKISNAQGSATSKEATLTVKPGPTITAEPVAQTVNVGASVSFTVSATGEQLQYQWLRDEQPITGATTATYTLSATVAGDDGALISVLVGNPGGVVGSAAATLTVLSSPAITVPPLPQTVVAGDPLLLGVSAVGGNLRYQWRRNGSDLEGATRRVLRVPAISLEDDNAVYSVSVSNSLGTAVGGPVTLRVVAGELATLPTSAAQVALAKPGAATAAFTLVRRSNGTVASWGYNAEGQRGDGTTGLASDTIGTVTLPAGRSARQVVAGGLQALVLLDNGEVHAWGLNDVGQLGLGDVVSRTAPAKVTLPRAAIAIAAGRQFSLALLDDGRVFSWGANDIGQLGNNAREPALLPVQVSALTDVLQIAAGSSHALALRADGSVWAWGANASGQLGDGSFKPSRVPVAMGLTQIARIRAGGSVSAAVSRRRGLYLWGENADGQLGLGAGGPGDVGVATVVRRGAIDAAAGERGTLVLGNDGLLLASGANDAGSLGDGGSTARNTFAGVSVVNQVTAFDIGGLSYAAAIGADGTTWTWGDNASEQLGNSTLPATGTTTPTVVPSFDAVP